jgi:predicted ATP-grasp superfamily ATP-dependent carboligase
MSTRVPEAVIVGGDLNALGVARSLAAGGVSMTIVGADRSGPAMRSRHGRKLLVTETGGEPLLRALEKIAQGSANAPILFLTEERSVRTVSEQRARVLPHYRLRLPDHDRLMALMHKQGFQDLAEAQGAPIPATVNLRSREDLAKLAQLRFPCVLKPAKKDYAYGARFKKGYVVNSPAEVAQHYVEIAPVLADMVVQEWIAGADGDIYFTLQYVGANGSTVSSFTGRKIRSWPPRVGGTASCTAAWDEAETLNRLTAEFFAAVGFTGMGSMEYKRDQRDGRFYMIEPTVARTDFQQEAATVNGVNLPLAAFLHECGRPVPQQRRIAPPRVWRDTQVDRWAREASGGASETQTERLPVVDAYWRADDPMPWVHMMLERLAERIGRRR